MSSPKYSLKNCVLQKSYFLWEFQVETLYVCQKSCFEHTSKVSVWNSYHKRDFCIFSRDYFGELKKRQWNTPQNNMIMNFGDPLGSIYDTDALWTQFHMIILILIIISSTHEPYKPWHQDCRGSTHEYISNTTVYRCYWSLDVCDA